MAELWYGLKQIPDLTLNKYASLEGKGVDGVIDKHASFLRQLNRKGIVSGLSFHLFYLYLVPEDKSKDRPGHRLHIFLLVRGRAEAMESMDAIINASPLADFYHLESKYKTKSNEKVEYNINNVVCDMGVETPMFNTCAILSKSETILSSAEGEGYYMLRDWDMNEDGRLYNMCKMMEAINHSALYRVDLYPVEKSVALRESLKKPMSILRGRQDERGINTKKDYEGRDVLKSYEDLIEKYETSPHFVTNIIALSNGKEDAISILDSAGSEGLIKGKYNISTFYSNFDTNIFLDGQFDGLENMRDGMIVRRGNPGLVVCREETSTINLNYLPTLFTLEEVAPFFRLPALYDGEIVQIAKETAPISVEKKDALFLGKDKNGYDVYFPLSLLPKHAFVSGVPGSGKTNTMHHITSSLWKEHHIPFLVLEPAKQEYRALANDPGMKEMYLFSPNADMSFPLHINPFEMPKGILVAEHIRKLCSVFEGAFPLEPPMPFLLDTAIEAVYRELGWIPEHIYRGDEKLEGSEKKRPLPTMSMLYKRLEEELKSTRYSEEVRGNLESALKVRIGSLLRREMGDVFDVAESSFVPEKWLEVPAVIELESMGTGPANFLTLMLCSLIRETLKVNPKYDGPVRHVIFIEEAHNLIGPESEEHTGADADPKQAATAFVVKMLAEVRALKEGIVIADQLPTVMAQEVLKNTGLKIGLRITSQDDRSLLGSTMAASSMQLEQMATFAVGESLIFYEKLMRPFIMRIKEWWGELSNINEKEEMVSPKNDAELRDMLRTSDTYLDANFTSVKIILDKYRTRLEELNKDLGSTKENIEKGARVLEQINKKNDYLLKVATREIELDDSEVEKKWDNYLNLINLFINWLNKETLAKPVQLVMTLLELQKAISRLRNGRWKRFGIDNLQLAEVNSIQLEILDRAKEQRQAFELLLDQVIPIGNINQTDTRYDLVDKTKRYELKKIAMQLITVLEEINIIVERDKCLQHVNTEINE